MTISRETWAMGMGLLGEYYRRTLSAPLAALYLEQLSAELNDDEFTAAVKLTIRDVPATFNHFPSVAEILARVRITPPLEAEAARAFDAVLALRSDDRNEGTVRAQLGDVAADTFASVGGRRRFYLLTDDEAVWARKEWLRLYVEHAAKDRATALAIAAGAPDVARLARGIAGALTMDRTRRLAPGADA